MVKPLPLKLVTQCLMSELNMSEQEITSAGVRLLQWFWEKKKNGYELLSAKGDDIRKVELEIFSKD